MEKEDGGQVANVACTVICIHHATRTTSSIRVCDVRIIGFDMLPARDSRLVWHWGGRTPKERKKTMRV